jgi:hypothetical protein
MICDDCHGEGEYEVLVNRGAMQDTSPAYRIRTCKVCQGHGGICDQCDQPFDPVAEGSEEVCLDCQKEERLTA